MTDTHQDIEAVQADRTVQEIWNEFDLEDMRRFLHVETLDMENTRLFLTVIPRVPIPKDDPSLPWYVKLVGRLWEMKYEGYGIAISASPHSTIPGRYYTTSAGPVALTVFENLPGSPGSQPDQTPVDWTKEKAKVRDALRSIPASIDWKSWHDDVLKPLCHASGGSEDCYELLDEWACTCAKYATKNARRENRRQWETIKKREHQELGKKRRRLGSFYRLAYQYGWQGWTEPVSVEFASLIQAGSLAEKTIADLRDAFKHYEPKHNPSPAQWDALSDLAAHLEAMANGTANPRYYLSSLDPGVGKTQTITHFVKVLQTSPDYDEVGAIIFVGRHEEIRSFIEAMDLDEGAYSVCVSDNDEEGRKLNALGNPLPDKARLIFTTQQMLEQLTKGGREFSSLEKFFYRRKPRVVRIWDETCLPARALTIDLELIQELERVATKADQVPLKNMLGTLIIDIRQNIGEIITLPDFGKIGLDHETSDGVFRQNQKLRDAIFDLALLSGKTARIVRDGRNRTIVDYAKTLPDDLKPMVITDASGRVRQTYHYWSDGRGDLVKLREGDKSYENLTVNIWERAASKSAWSKDHKELLAGVTSAIHAKGDDEGWLIVHPKPHDHFNSARNVWTEVDIPKLLQGSVRNPGRLTFVHWGGSEFRATNRFREVRNVMLAGTHFLPKPAYQALARLSLGLPSDEPVPTEVLTRIERGEHANFILQAVCRASVRRSAEGGCGQCEVHIIAAPRSGIPSMLKAGAIFPNAKVRDWSPVDVPLRGRIGEVMTYFERLPEGVVERLARTVAEDVGMDYDNFVRRVVRDGQFSDRLGRSGWQFVPGSGSRSAAFRRGTNGARQESLRLAA